jgi:anti-anti-sigma factor
MRAVNFVDSSGLGLLIRAHRLVQQRPSARLVLHGVNTNVRNVIRISKLEQLFQIHDGNT